MFLRLIRAAGMGCRAISASTDGRATGRVMRLVLGTMGRRLRLTLPVLALILLASCVGCGSNKSGGSASRSPSSSEDGETAQALTGSGSNKPIPDLIPDISELDASTAENAIAAQFVDVADQLGMRFTYDNDPLRNRYRMPEIMGGGVAWLDFDLDGQFEPVFANGADLDQAAESIASGSAHGPDFHESRNTESRRTNQLFQQRGANTFSNVTQFAHCADEGFGHGCAVADFDRDGFPDLFFTNYGEDALYLNLGDGTFEKVACPDFGKRPAWSTSAAWVDVNRDGNVDLVVINYIEWNLSNHLICRYANVPGYCGPGRFPATSDVVYLNQGDGRFTASGEELGFVESGKGLVVAAVDVNEDLVPEIYIGNDLTANFLYVLDQSRNEIHYDDRASSAGVDLSGDGAAEASMGIACWDFDRDESVDIYLTHYFKQKNTLYRNLSAHRELDAISFEDDSFRSRAAATSLLSLGFGVSVIDYDLNGDGDIFVTNGNVLGRLHPHHEMRPQLLRNRGNAVFDDVSSTSGDYFERTFVGRGLAGCDFDNDGDLDIAISHLEKPSALLRNETQHSNHFIGLVLIDANRRSLVGSRVVVETETGKQTIPVVAGGSYLSNADPRLLAGLALDQKARVTVYWSDGQVDVWEDLDTDRYWTFMQCRCLDRD